VAEIQPSTDATQNGISAVYACAVIAAVVIAVLAVGIALLKRKR